MGSAEGPVLGVVDEQLRDHGIEGLRVAGFNIPPMSPVTHLQEDALSIGRPQVKTDSCEYYLSWPL